MKFSDEKPYKVVALCIAKFNGNEQKELIDLFYKVCEKRNFRLHIFSTMTDFYFENLTDPGEIQIFDLMEPERYDAVVIFTSSFKRLDIAEDIAKKVIKSGTPCFALMGNINGCINMNIDFDDSFEMVVRHMVEYHKPKHINFIAGTIGNVYSEERLEVFKKVLRENNIPVEEDRIGYGDFWEMPTEQVMNQFLESGKPIDAIICANDSMAMEVCRQLEKADIRVPEDIIVSGFDGIALEKYHYPRLATCQQDLVRFCELLGEAIDDVSDQLPIENSYEVGCIFRAGQSCGCHSLNTNTITLGELGKAYFNARRHEAVMGSNVETFYEKIPSLVAEDKMAATWNMLCYLHKSYVSGDFVLALNNDFIGDDTEIWPSVRPLGLSDEHHYYTDKMVVAFEYFNEEKATGVTIRKTDLVPDYDKYADKREILMFLPFHVQGSTTGYVAEGFVPGKFEYFMLYAYVMNLRHVVEMHKYRLDQQNLYSTDQLTKLLNRKGFYRHMESRIKHAIKNQKKLAVISVDMNWLKQINDTFGHKEGDFALAKIGTILENAVGEYGVCTRFGGDEFAIALVDDNAEERAKSVINEIQTKLDEFNMSDKKPYPLSVSKGYVVHIPDNSRYQLERFIVEADREMYKDKAEFKRTHCWEGKQEY